MVVHDGWIHAAALELNPLAPLFSVDIRFLRRKQFGMNPNPPGFDPRAKLPPGMTVNGQKVTRGGIIVDGRHTSETLPHIARPGANIPSELIGQEAPPGFIPHGKTLLAAHLTQATDGISSTIDLSAAAHTIGATTVEARVLVIGPDVTHYEAGQRILVGNTVGNKIFIKGKQYNIVREEDVFGKFTGE